MTAHRLRVITSVASVATALFVATHLYERKVVTASSQCSCEEECNGDPCPQPGEGEDERECDNMGPADPCLWDGGCPPGEEYSMGCCIILGTPIAIDLAGDGLQFTNTAAGVMFRITRGGLAYKVTWTLPGADDAWLVLDRNGNGQVDDGGELFGNFTEQREPAKGIRRNGFLALAEFDDTSNGGNGDAQITDADQVFGRLLLWRDVNHDGMTDRGELEGLMAAGVNRIDLRYSASHDRDKHDNVFRYQSKVYRVDPADPGRLAADIILKVVPRSPKQR